MSILSTRSEFEDCLLLFYNDIQTLGSDDGWTWETKSILRHSFLKKNSIILPNHPRIVQEEEEIMQVNEELDFACTSSSKIDMIEIEYHIVYSTSYQVPVLYFRAHYSDGTPLVLIEIYKQIVPDMYHDQVIISQNEHPILNTPWWYIHPCDTRKLMNTIDFDFKEYIKTWLSFHAPIVKCQLTKELFL